MTLNDPTRPPPSNESILRKKEEIKDLRGTIRCRVEDLAVALVQINRDNIDFGRATEARELFEKEVYGLECVKEALGTSVDSSEARRDILAGYIQKVADKAASLATGLYFSGSHRERAEEASRLAREYKRQLTNLPFIESVLLGGSSISQDQIAISAATGIPKGSKINSVMVGMADGSHQEMPNLVTVIQNIVDRQGWVLGGTQSFVDESSPELEVSYQESKFQSANAVAPISWASVCQQAAGVSERMGIFTRWFERLPQNYHPESLDVAGLAIGRLQQQVDAITSNLVEFARTHEVQILRK